MRQCLLHVAHVASLEIRSSGTRSCCEHRHSSLAADVVLPLVGVRMPVEFTHTSRAHLNNRRRDRCRHFKETGIDNAHVSSFCPLGDGLFREAKSKIRGDGPRLPAAATWSLASSGGTSDWKMNSSSVGILARACEVVPKFLANTSLGVCAIHSESSTVAYSEKLPSSKTNKNSAPSGPSP